MSNQSALPHKLHVGDTVTFSENFVDRHSRHSGSMAIAQGKVKALHPLKDVTLADIEWNMPGLPKRVNVTNLVKVSNSRS